MNDDRVVIVRSPWPPGRVLKSDGSTNTFRHETRDAAVWFAPRHSHVLLDRRLKMAAMFGVCGVVSVSAAGREVVITATRARLIIGGAACAVLMVAVGMLVLAGAWLLGTVAVAMMLAFAWQLMAECRQVAQLAVRELGVDDDEARR